MTIEASDQRNPPNTANATLIVDITQNALPTFTNLPASMITREDVAVGQNVFDVTATDADLQVSN